MKTGGFVIAGAVVVGAGLLTVGCPPGNECGICPSPNTTLAADAGGSGGALDNDTVAEYLSALERLMIIEHQPAWATHLRSKSILRRSPKRHFVDPSLAVAALRASPARLLSDLNLFGFLFESLVVRDLRIYSQAADASVYHYRDNTGLEVDAIVQSADGRWAAFEIKLGAGHVDNGAATLLKFADRVDTEKSGEPAVLAVITSTRCRIRAGRRHRRHSDRSPRAVNPCASTLYPG